VTIAQKTTYVSETETLLTEMMRKPNIMGMLASFSQQVQDLENAIFAVLNGRDINNAEGVQLDGLGALVGEPRNGRDDTTYRLRIRARIKLNVSSGTPNEILELFALLIDSGQTAKLVEKPPASFNLTIGGTSGVVTATAVELGRLLQQAKPAGVKASLIYSTDSDTNTFTLSSLPNALESSATQGMADAAQTSGGKMAGVI
jgi:hypothetical protein